jgi:hypothetical protein
MQVVSQPGLSVSGRVLPLPGLAEVQGAAFNTPTIVLAQVRWAGRLCPYYYES